MIVFSIFNAIHKLLSESIISTRSRCVALSGSIFFGSPFISVSMCIKFHVHHLNISLNSHIIFELVTSTQSSSLISLIFVCSIVSHFSTFQPGKTYFCHFL